MVCDPKQRAKVRQATRAGIIVQKRRDFGAVELFYELHSRVRTLKHKLLPQPRIFFQNLFDIFFPRSGHVMVAELNGKPLAAMIFLSEGNTLYYKFSASDLQALTYRPNNFLIWKAIEDAIGDGYEYLDLGISEDPGLIGFKERLGADAVPVVLTKYLQTQKSKPVAELENTFGALTAVLTDPLVPTSMAQTAANSLYRYFV
jgi:lipid II:glycine glycyltransferase (peptidoglycan interpeptide bridge formation enzyme)